jgi:hypothetical protein
VAIEPGIVLRPRHLAAGDFDADGRDDLAVAQGTAVHVLISRGDGTCEVARMSAASGTSIVSGDFDGDGRVDLAVADWEVGEYAVLRGLGDGQFLPAVITSGSSPFIAVGDFDGDGRDDLADERAVLLSAADGTFRSTVPLPAAPALPGEASDVIARDVDGDGDADVVVASEDQVAWYRGNGDGTFEGATVYSELVRPGLVAGDFSGDGLADVAAVSGGVLSFMRQRAGGGLTFFGLFPTSPRGLVGMMVTGRSAAADFDGDGRTEVVTQTSVILGAAQRPVLWFVPGTADGAFARAPDLRMGAAGARGFGIVVGDFDGDERPDLAYAEGSDVNLLSSSGM